MQARKWLREHGFKVGKHDETKKLYRFRQENPDKFQPTSFRTVKIRPGVQAVIARPIGKDNPMAKKKTTKKKATKKKSTKKKATKKKSTKKKATKKKSTKRRKSNPLGFECKANGKTLSSSKPTTLWTVWLNTIKGRIPVGQVTARTKAEAKKKASAYLRKKFK